MSCRIDPWLGFMGAAFRGVTLGVAFSMVATAYAADGAGYQARALLEPLHEAVLSSEIAAKVVSLPRRDGEAFKRGAVLVKFDCAAYEAQLAGARADELAADKKLANNRQLAELNSIGALEVDLAEAQLLKAQAETRLAEIRVERCTIKAPYRGRVVELKVHEHDSVPEGEPLLSILDDSELELKIIVPSNWLGWLQRKALLKVRIDETGKTYPAHVSKIGARIDPVSQSIKVTAAFDSGADGLIAGMSGTALFQGPGATHGD